MLKTFLRSFLLMLISVFLVTPTGFAQVVVPEKAGTSVRLKKQVFGLGFAAGATTGLGISFRHHLPSRISYGIIGGIIKVDRDLSYDIGFEAQWDLSRNEAARFFAVGGTSFFYSGTSDENKLEGPLRFGLGIGGEFNYLGVLNVSLEGLFTFFSDGTILPLPQVSAHYYFF
ncbi:MAG: hypothetical protein ACE5H0_03155 [Bacteroidota bacterium]